MPREGNQSEAKMQWGKPEPMETIRAITIAKESNQNQYRLQRVGNRTNKDNKERQSEPKTVAKGGNQNKYRLQMEEIRCNIGCKGRQTVPIKIVKGANHNQIDCKGG